MSVSLGESIDLFERSLSMKIRLRFFVLELDVIGMLSLVPITKVEAASKDIKISKTNFLSVIDLSNNKKVNCVLADENQKIVGWEKE